MSDFLAKVIAQLDMSQANNDMNAFLNKDHKLKVKVDLDTGNVNVDNLLNQIKSQFQSVGRTAGQNMATAINSSLGSINTKNSKYTIRNLQRTLASFKFDRSQINTITESLNSMDLAVQKVETRIRQGGQLNLRVQGVDELGRSVTVLKEFDQASGTLRNVGKNISQSFDGISSAGKSISDSFDASKLSASIEVLNANFIKLKGSVSNESTELQKLKEDLSAISNISGFENQQTEFARISQRVKELSVSYKEAKAEATSAAAAQQLLSGKAVLGNQIEAWMNRNTKAAKIYKSELSDLESQLAKVGNAADLKNVSQMFNQLKTTAAAEGNLGKGIFATLKSNFTSLSPLFGMGTMINTVISGLKEMYSNVVNIDSALTELKKVTNETDSAYSQFTSEASKRSVELGTTITDYINSTASFARLGYSMSESKELAEVANIYSVVGDEISNIDEASSSVISTMQAFDIQASDSMSIVDKFNEVGNDFAISSGGIGEALTRSASSMSAANNTLDESIALITAANTVVQDAPRVGNAFKTISMRIRGATTELEDAGLETDGMAESTAKLQAEIKALSGVDIMLDKDTFKSTYQIMDELSQKWESLTDIQQASITELIAGKHQGNVMSSLMENFDIARQALDVSMNSEGSAMEEHEKYMDSIEARISQLKAAWEGLSNSFIDSGFVKSAVSGLTEIVEVITTLIDSIGTLGTIGVGAGIASLIKNFGKLLPSMGVNP